MTEPSPARPVPGPPSSSPPTSPADDPASPAGAEGRFDELDQRPVSEHVGVFEAEHDRLQRELGTIDRL